MEANSLLELSGDYAQNKDIQDKKIELGKYFQERYTTYENEDDLELCTYLLYSAYPESRDLENLLDDHPSAWAHLPKGFQLIESPP